jgi:hypothetical protein
MRKEGASPPDLESQEQSPRNLTGTVEKRQPWSGPKKKRREVSHKRISHHQKTKTMECWLGLLGGSEVDVVANGHCGWIAFYAALYNSKDGLVQPSKAVVTHANMLKKRVVNEMIANLQDEAKLHHDEMRIEVEACVGSKRNLMTDAEKVCVVANHLAEQRVKTVRAAVPMHFTVRLMHLKAMAIHARKTIYVLDALEDGQARFQAFAYHNVRTLMANGWKQAR